jgi:hypothetical protein
MDATDDTGKTARPERATAPEAEAATAASTPASDGLLGPDAAAIIALALLANATGFGPQTTTLALVLLPVVLFVGIAAHSRLVEINREEVELVLAMNRLRHAYLRIAPALEPYFTTGHHDDEQGLAASYLLVGPGGLRPRPWGQFLVNTPTIVATVDAALAAAIVVLVVRAAEAATTVAVAAGVVPWDDLPVWIPVGHAFRWLHDGDVSRAYAAGLRCRPVAQTVADTWQRLRTVGGCQRAPTARNGSRWAWTRRVRPNCLRRHEAPFGTTADQGTGQPHGRPDDGVQAHRSHPSPVAGSQRPKLVALVHAGGLRPGSVRIAG